MSSRIQKHESIHLSNEPLEKGWSRTLFDTMINPGYRLIRELTFIPLFGVKNIDMALIIAKEMN